MAGSPTFSTQAATVLVDAYLAQPEGNRDLRKVLAAAKQGQLPLKTDTYDEAADIQREIAAMSQSQAYELLRADGRYQPSILEQATDLSERNLAIARRIIEQEEARPQPNWTQLRRAQRLINLATYGTQPLKRPPTAQEAEALGLAALLT